MSPEDRGDPAELPVAAALPTLLDALGVDGGAAVIVAEPGAGKTTLVPSALLDTSWCTQRVVLVEPRRLAARAAATRIAALRGEPVGRTVGWRMRGDTRVSAATRLEVVTDGVLTRMLQADPSLSGIDAVVFDELHERSVDTDLGLALCLDVRGALRPDLRIVAMSATIDGAVVADLLGTTTVLTVPGRTHPVATVWIEDAPASFDPRAVVRACRRALHETRRDVLVFLPGAAEIRAVQRALDSVELDAVDVLPLHGSLSPDEQDRALASAARDAARSCCQLRLPRRASRSRGSTQSWTPVGVDAPGSMSAGAWVGSSRAASRRRAPTSDEAEPDVPPPAGAIDCGTPRRMRSSRPTTNPRSLPPT